MNKVNRLLNEIIDEIWAIKRYESEIELEKIVDFYKLYNESLNLVIDAINAQIIKYDGFEMPFSQKDISYLIENFIIFNKYNYNRLIAEILFILDNEQAYLYLSKILDTDSKKQEFESEFNRWPSFTKTKRKLEELGVFF